MRLKNPHNYIKFFLALFFGIVLIFRGVSLLDPDFGWHLKTGQIILESGFFYKDIFSYTMPSFPYVDHAWLTDVIMAILFNRSPFLLVLFFSLLVFAIVWFFIKEGERLKLPAFFAYSFPLLYFAVIISFVGVRTQVITLFNFSLLLGTFFYWKSFIKYKWFLPILFLLWANLHGGFLVGLLSLAFFIGVQSLKERKIRAENIFLILACTAATFINPYGVGIWKEAVVTSTSGVLRKYIEEWQPGVTYVNIALYLLVPLSGIGIVKYWRKFEIEIILFYLILLYQSITTVRHIPLFATAATLVAIHAASFFHKEIMADKEKLKRFIFASKFFLGFVGVFSLLGVAYTIYGTLPLSEHNYFPEKASEYLKQNLPQGEIFSEYAWGGYLIWKLPEKKVFIDGRMAIWKQDKKEGELSASIEDFLKIFDGTFYFRPYFEKFDVELVLLSTRFEKNGQSLGDALWSKIFGIEVAEYNLLTDLKNHGWKTIYSDEVSVIYKRPW